MQAYGALWCRCAQAAKQCCDEMRYLEGAGRGHYSTGGKWVRGGRAPAAAVQPAQRLLKPVHSSCRGRLGAAAAAAGGHHVRWAGAVGDGAQQVQAGHQAEEVRQQRIGGGLRWSRAGRATHQGGKQVSHSTRGHRQGGSLRTSCPAILAVQWYAALPTASHTAHLDVEHVKRKHGVPVGRAGGQEWVDSGARQRLGQQHADGGTQAQHGQPRAQHVDGGALWGRGTRGRGKDGQGGGKPDGSSSPVPTRRGSSSRRPNAPAHCMQ